MTIQVAIMIGLAVFTSACTSKSEAKDVPAVIAHPTKESRAELERAVSSALNGIRVILADDALTRGSLLTLEHNPPRDLQGKQLTGRQLSRPEQFRLVMRPSDCILLHHSSGTRWHLREANWTPE